MMSKRSERDSSSLIAPSSSSISSNMALSLMVAIFLIVSSSISPYGLGAHGQVNFSTGWYNGKRSSLPAVAPSLRSNGAGGRPSAETASDGSEAGTVDEPLFKTPQQQQPNEDHQHRDETILGTRRATSRSLMDPTIMASNPSSSSAASSSSSRIMGGSEGDSMMSNRIFPIGHQQGHHYNHDDTNNNNGPMRTMSKRIPLGPDELIERLEASMSGAITTTTPEECRVMSPAALNNIYRLLFREAEKMVQCGRIFGRKKRSTGGA